MHIKKRILVFTDWYLPGYRAGGPIRSLANLVGALDHEFFIVTRNTDHHSTQPYADIIPNVWLRLSDNVHVIYLEESRLTTTTFLGILREKKYDKIYFNSLFSPRFTLLPLRLAKKEGLAEKCVLAPRGMLKTGALSIKSNKKKIFLTIAKLVGLYSKISWHATNKEEADEIHHHFGRKADVRVSPNLTMSQGTLIKKGTKNRGELKMICIARISPEKGILEALKFLKDAHLGKNVCCVFYGTQQNAAYLAECKKMASTIKDADISFPGEINPESIPALMSQSQFFYMTTWGENFGHSISEALLTGTPVIISNRTPWRNLEHENAGWDLPLETTSFSPILKKCYDMADEEFQKLSLKAYEYGHHKAHDPAMVEAGYSIFA